MENVARFFLVIFILLPCAYKITSACNGYYVKVNRLENCNTTSLVKAENLGIVLDKDCNLIPSGCIFSNREIKIAKARYSLSKPPLPPLEGELDFCESLKNNREEFIRTLLGLFQLPNTCPIPATKICGSPNTKVNISKFKNRLPLAAGTINVKLDMTHDNGASCFEGSVNLEKNRQG